MKKINVILVGLAAILVTACNTQTKAETESKAKTPLLENNNGMWQVLDHNCNDSHYIIDTYLFDGKDTVVIVGSADGVSITKINK